MSILRRDPLLNVVLPNGRWNVYANAAPAEKDGHFILLPTVINGTATTIPHLPQKLTPDILSDALALLNSTMGLEIIFNSPHAGASVHHIHLQAIAHKQTVAIEKASTKKIGRFTILNGYPANGIVFDHHVKIGEIFPCIDRLQENGIPLNLILVGEKVYLMPRNAQHEVVSEIPSSIMAAGELAGQIRTISKDLYDNMNHTALKSALGKTTISLDNMIAILLSL